MNFGGSNIRLSFSPAPQRNLEDMSAEELRAVVAAMAQQIEDASEKGTVVGTVIAEEGDRVSVHVGAQIVQIRKPRQLPVKVPSFVRIAPGQMGPSIVGMVENPPMFGVLAVVQHVDEERKIAVCSIGPSGVGNDRVLLYAGEPPKRGERVTCDVAMTAITSNLGKPPSEMVLTEETGVSWDDIGGCEDVKVALREAVEEPVIHRELYEKFGKRPTKGVLLHGPPGVGKTMFAKAVATSLAKLHGATATAGGFISIKGPELLNKFVGATEEGVRALFMRAREHQVKHGYPAVVCIDEADALLARRGSMQGGGEGMERTTVPQFLAEMDGIGDSGALVLLLTNRPEVLDPAVVRDGRVDRRVEVRRPNEAEAAEIALIALRGKPCADAGDLAKRAARAIYGDGQAIYVVRTKSTADVRLSLRDFVSGALVVGVVERATRTALRRAIAGDAAEVTAADVEGAVAEAKAELHGLDHTRELNAAVAGLPPEEVLRVERGGERSRGNGMIIHPWGK